MTEMSHLQAVIATIRAACVPTFLLHLQADVLPPAEYWLGDCSEPLAPPQHPSNVAGLGGVPPHEARPVVDNLLESNCLANVLCVPETASCCIALQSGEVAAYRCAAALLR